VWFCVSLVVARMGGWIGVSVEEEKRLKEANNATPQNLECGE
jgi:butyrate kinase